MKTIFNKTALLILSAWALLFLFGCSEGTGDGTGGDDPGTTPPPVAIEIAQVAVDADPSTINIMESSSVTGAVYDQSGSPVAGVYVSFTMDQPSLAYFSPSIALTGGNGIAYSTLTTREHQGSLNITATSGTVTSNPLPVSVLSGVSPGVINVTANPTTVMVEGTSAITAEVLDQDNLPVPDGTTVSFEVSNETFGSMSPPQSTTINGMASATFTADNQPGTAAIEVSVGNVNNSVDILINQSQPASLEFFSAEPQRITLAGSGGNETSDIRFRVIDENGNPVSGIEVSITIEKGPNGGEYIDNDDTPEEITVSSDALGHARIILRSGTTAGPVSLKGIIDVQGVTYTASSSIVSIGGGVPTASRFSVAASVLNVPGLNENNKTTDITAYMSDRFGNYNILKGTTVSFWSEAALAVDAATATINEDGLATVVARTQHPVLNINLGGQDVAPLTWENNLLSYVSSTYGWGGTTHPRDGLTSVLVYSQGEEHFDDLNANGVYDSGEPFQDTHDDPFIDYNDNGNYNVYVSPGDDPTEIFNDVNKSGGWDSVNGEWDSQKDIFTNFKILITGPPIIGFSPGSFNIPNGGSQAFKILVCDRNLNYLSAGTKISMSIVVDVENGDKLVGLSADSVELDDSSYLPGAGGVMADHLDGKIEFNALIYDKVPSDSFAVPVKFTVTVKWEGKTEAVTIFGMSH